MEEPKKVIVSYYCRACEVEGREVEETPETPIRCWNCGKKPEIINRGTEQAGIMYLHLRYSEGC